MSKLIQAIRGMNDVLPSETPIWQHIEHTLKNTLNAHGYQEIRFPLIEKTELFKRTIGEATDIVEKEMYTFLDRHQDSLSLRPEGTASCVRANIEHGLLRQSTQRLWYMGPFFRHERPQRGRYRQFHQCSVEAYGIGTPDIDAEVILISARLIQSLGLENHAVLQLNSLGSKECRQHYRKQLQDYFLQHQQHLDEDSQRRLHTNPLRILDSKNPDLHALIEAAPKLVECLDSESQVHFEQLKHHLSAMGLRYEVNPKLVRGLDYYCRTVFEWVTNELGAQGTICGGGRYDHLIEQLGGPNTPAIGFSLGLERAVLLCQQLPSLTQVQPKMDMYIISANAACFIAALQLRDALYVAFQSQLTIIVHCGGGSLKNQFKKADKSGALYAVVIGEEEHNQNKYAVKSLRDNQEQVLFSLEQLIQFFREKR